MQQFQHTDLMFSLMYFAFCMLSVFAFNLAEGFTRLTGAYVFWFAILIVIAGVCWKVVVNEPADTNLQVPLLDMALYTGSMGMLLCVTLLNKQLDVRKLGVGGGLAGANLDLTTAGLGCLVAGLSIDFSGLLLQGQAMALQSALSQVNFLLPMGIILSTAGSLRETDGKRSTNLINVVAMLFLEYQGIYVFSKQGMLTPILCWLVGAFYARMRVRPTHIVFMLFVVFATLKFVGPLSESRDLIQDQPPERRIPIIIYQLTHWTQFKEHVDMLESRGGHDQGAPSYYNAPQGSFIERLSMMPPDDRLIAYSARGNFSGIAPVIEWFENVVPRFLYPNKTNDYTGNYFAHKAGGYLSSDDFSTGISFSPVSSAYNCEGWGGILWLMPGIWILLFTSVDFVVGDLTRYPWGLLVIVWFGHATPESLLSGMIYYISYGNLGMLVAIIICTRIAPVIGSLFYGRSIPVETRSVGRARITPQLQP